MQFELMLKFLGLGVVIFPSFLLYPASAQTSPTPLAVTQDSEVGHEVEHYKSTDQLSIVTSAELLQLDNPSIGVSNLKIDAETSGRGNAETERFSPFVLNESSWESDFYSQFNEPTDINTFEEDTEADTEDETDTEDNADTEDGASTDADPTLESQIDVSDYDDLIEIIITGTRTPRLIEQSPLNVTVIDIEDIRFNLDQDIGDLIRYEPGVSVNRDLTYGLTDFNIRGLERNRILLQIDGIRLPTLFEFGSSLLGRNYVDLSSIGSVEIIRGPASTLYGSDALGGVVSYFTPKPSDLIKDGEDTYLNLSTIYRSANNSYSGLATAAFRPENNIEGLLSFAYRQRGAREINGDERFQDPFDGETINILGKLVYRMNDSSDLTFTGEYFQDRGDFDFAEDNLNLALTFPGITVLSDGTETETERQRFSLAYEYDDVGSSGFLQFARAQIYYQNADYDEVRTRNDFAFGSFRFRDLDNTFDENIFGGEAQFRSDFSTGAAEHKLTYGFDISNTFNRRIRDGSRENLTTGVVSNRIGPDTFPIKDFPDSDTLRLGIYVQDEIEIDQITLIPGVRFDYYSLDTQPDALFLNQSGAEASDLTDSAVSPSLSLLYQATPEIALIGRYAEGFRGPNYTEINSGFSNTFGGYRTLSNPDLQPETSNTFELGVRGGFQQARFSLTGFYSTYDNFIEQFETVGTEPTGCFPPFSPGCVQVFQSVNLEKVEIYGVEFQGEYRFSPDPDGFSLMGAISWVQGNDKETDKPLESINPFEAVLGLRYRAREERWGAELISTFVGEARVEEDPGEFIPESYFLLDLTGYVKLGKNVTLRGGVFNILDTDYVTYADARRLNDTINSVTTDPAFNQRRTRLTQPGINFGFTISVELP